jgi:CoA-transferase family III
MKSLAGLVLLLALPLWAQTGGTGALTVTVTDPSGAVVPGASVTVHNAAGVSRTDVTLNRVRLEKILADHFYQGSGERWISILRASGIPCSLVQTLPQVVEDEQALFREMFPVVYHPTAGTGRAVGPPIKFSETPGRASVPAPLLGQHTREVLHDVLGFDTETVGGLIVDRVVFEPESIPHTDPRNVTSDS